MYGFLFIVCTVLCSKHIILKGPFNVELYRMVYWARSLFLDFSRVMHFSVTTREFSSILEGVKKLSPQFPPAKNLLQVKESFMRPFKIHLHKHFGRKVTRKYIFQRKQKNPISQRKRPFASKRTIINDSRPYSSSKAIRGSKPHLLGNSVFRFHSFQNSLSLTESTQSGNIQKELCRHEGEGVATSVLQP